MGTLPSRAAIAAALLAAMWAPGCFYSPTVTNKSVDAYPTPDAKGAVLVLFEPAEGETKATFKVRGHDEITIAADDSPGDKFGANVDTSKLTEPGVYFVELTKGDGSPGGALPFVKPAGGTAPAPAGTPTPTPAG